MKWLRLVLVFVILDLFAFGFIAFLDKAVFEAVKQKIANLLGPGGARWPSPSIYEAIICITWIFLLDVFVLWLLSKIGGPLKADIKASIKKFGGSIWITGAGLLGAFIALALLGFGALYALSR